MSMTPMASVVEFSTPAAAQAEVSIDQSQIERMGRHANMPTLFYFPTTLAVVFIFVRLC